mmetsp:Transcript_1732/g.1522  ORF Transcript_1732/g.1522 Transcript_1732/m.1522 type:complete len:110 (-) Transcript_1732:956-1285(-)
MKTILKDLNKYKKKISKSRKSIFKCIDDIVDEAKETNKYLKTVKQQNEDEHSKSVKAVLKIKNMNKKLYKIVKKNIVQENKNIYDSISKIGKNITKCKTFGDASSHDID